MSENMHNNPGREGMTSGAQENMAKSLSPLRPPRVPELQFT